MRTLASFEIVVRVRTEGGLHAQLGSPQKARINPMQSKLTMHLSPRCSARSKRSGKPCQSPAVRGHSVCRMHGAKGGAPISNRNALRNGRFTCKALELRQMIAGLTRDGRSLAQSIR